MGYGMDGPDSIPDRCKRFFSFCTAPRQALGPAQPHIQWVKAALYAGCKVTEA